MADEQMLTSPTLSELLTLDAHTMASSMHGPTGRADWEMDATVPGARGAGMLTSPTQGKSAESVENPHSQQLKTVGFC